jgi:polyhydroxyalkanoate synthase subunit PhaC
MQQLMVSFMDAYFSGLRLSNTYNLVYLRAFERILAEQSREITEAATTAVTSADIIGIHFVKKLESMYNSWLKNVDKELETVLKSEHFTTLLSEYTHSLMELRSLFKKSGYPIDYLDWLFDWYVRSHMVFSLIQKESNLAPFDIVYTKGKARLLHFCKNGQEISSSSKKQDQQQQQPLLIIYAPINTFHILDLNPNRSVVRTLLASESLDIYLLDWGYPDLKDDYLSLDDYLGYVADAAKAIKDLTKLDKISVLGYCWGGLFALIHATLHPEEVRKLVLMAVPIDFSKDDTILSRWSKTIDVDHMIDEFGHMDGQVLNLGFIMRNPPRYGFDKYLKLFQKSYDRAFVETFVDVERWLYDTPPIPGPLFQQIVNDCYRNNKLISGDMEIAAKEGKKQKVDIKKSITMPVLSVVAQRDDLVSPASSLAINDHIATNDKTVLENPGGHVALCIGNNAHKKLWPEVATWLSTT